MNKSDIVKNLKKLKLKNIIKVIKVDNVKLKKLLAKNHKIYTKSIVLTNIFPDTWNVELTNIDDLLYIDEGTLKNEIEKRSPKE